MNNDIKKAFDAVTANEAMKEETKKKLLDMRKKPIPPRLFKRSFFMRASVGAAVFFLLLLGAVPFYQSNAEAAYITLEGDVSVGMSVNRKEEVISASGLNEYGEQAVQEVSVAGLKYQQAMRMIMSSDTYKKCQSGKAEATVSSEDEEKKNTMQQEADAVCGEHKSEQRRQQGRQQQGQNGQGSQQHGGHQQEQQQHQQEQKQEHQQKNGQQNGEEQKNRQYQKRQRY